MYHNRFTEMPLRALALFNHLTWLDMSGNALHSLPPEIARLHSLSVLDVRSNRLEGTLTNSHSRQHTLTQLHIHLH